MPRTSADAGLRRKYLVGISSLELFSAVRSVCARDSRGRGKNAATLLSRAVSPDSTRDGKNGNNAERREWEGEWEKRAWSCPFFVTSAPTRVFSLRSPSLIVAPLGERRSPSFFPQGLQIACQLNHNRDSGSRDNLASGYHGVSSPRPKSKVSAFTYWYM